MKKTLTYLMLLSLSIISTAQASEKKDFYCDGLDLVEGKTKEVARSFKKIGECERLLSESVDNRYCELGNLKDLKSAEIIREFELEGECEDDLNYRFRPQ